MMISAIVLAAGSSKRMGFCKQLLKINGITMIEHVVSNIGDSMVDNIIVVLGFNADEISKKLSNKKLKIVINKDYEKGMSTSLKVGLKAVNKDTKAIIFLNSDQPFIKSHIINRIIEEYERTSSLIIVPTHKGKKGHPVLLDISFRSDIMKIQGDVGARNIIRKYNTHVSNIEIDSNSILIDFDRIKDLKILQGRLG
jgi:molybdenum cofactor cytidylyltransferase